MILIIIDIRQSLSSFFFLLLVPNNNLLLEDHTFVRVHNSYLVNLNKIVQYVKGEGGYLVMSDGSTVDVSRSKKDLLHKKLLPYKE